MSALIIGVVALYVLAGLVALAVVAIMVLLAVPVILAERGTGWLQRIRARRR